MTLLWIVIWLLLTAFMLGVFGWTQLILLQQKSAWQAFAKKRGLTYTAGRLADPPAIQGAVGDVRLSLYTGVQQTPDVRGQRMVTVIEIELGPGMPTAAALATKEFAGFLSTLRMGQTFKPPLPEWKPDYLVRTRSVPDLAAYLTEDRARVLHGVFSMNSSIALYFFDEFDCVLRIETTDPLRNSQHLEKVVRRLLADAEHLALNAEERAAWAGRTPPPPPKEAAPAEAPLQPDPAAPPLKP